MSPAHESTLPPVLGVEQMGALLGMSVRSVYRAMHRPGWLFPPLPPLGRNVRWSRDQVLAILAAASSATPIRRRVAGR